MPYLYDPQGMGRHLLSLHIKTGSTDDINKDRHTKAKLDLPCEAKIIWSRLSVIEANASKAKAKNGLETAVKQLRQQEIEEFRWPNRRQKIHR